jgi:RNA polymerase sigma-70 factor (ECF subfamily)
MAAHLQRLTPPVEPTDVELVERALARDRWAEEAIYRRHVHRVTTVVARLLRHGSDIEDVVQETFLTAYRDLPKLREPRLLGRWLVQSAIHRCHKRFRRRRLRRLIGLESRDENLAEQAVFGTSPEVRAELALLDRVLDRMSDAERTCWVLRHLEEYQLQEVADLAGCSLATAKRRLARAQTVVRAHFDAPEEATDA